MAATAAGAAVALAALASGGTYAFMNSTATTGGAVVRSGTATLAVTGVLTMPGARLYPGGPADVGSAVVKNDGDVPLSLRVTGVARTGAATPFSGALVVKVTAVGPLAACPGTGTVSTNAVPSSTVVDLGVIVAKGATAKICVAASLPTEAVATANNNAAVSIAVTIDGKQVR